MKESNRLDHAVFWPPMIIFLGLVVLSLVNEDAFATTVTTAFYWLVGNFGWLMSLLVTFGVLHHHHGEPVGPHPLWRKGRHAEIHDIRMVLDGPVRRHRDRHHLLVRRGADELPHGAR